MNYRHIWHAGNFADVFKHILQVTLIEALQRKETPCFFLDTHAGIGRYDLSAPAAQTTREFESGILRVMGASTPPPLVQRYLACFPADKNLYPGSPCITRALLRPSDRLVLCELHPEDCQTLKACFRGDRAVAIHETDGWQSLKAFLPPRENRGLVLIDPPYEKTNEFQSVAHLLSTGVRRWPNGVFALWYPLKSNLPTTALRRTLAQEITRPLLIAEIHQKPTPGHTGLSGCGMAIVNPPWQMETTLANTLPWLCDALGNGVTYTLIS